MQHTTEQIILHIDQWSADSREALRHLLKWKPHGKTLGQLVVEALTTRTAAPRNVKQAIIDVLERRKVYSHACDALLHSKWTFTDPAGLVQKTPDEIKTYLHDLSYEVGMYDDLFSSRRNLLKMIFDAYLRWEQTPTP